MRWWGRSWMVRLIFWMMWLMCWVSSFYFLGYIMWYRWGYWPDVRKNSFIAPIMKKWWFEEMKEDWMWIREMDWYNVLADLDEFQYSQWVTECYLIYYVLEGAIRTWKVLQKWIVREAISFDWDIWGDLVMWVI